MFHTGDHSLEKWCFSRENVIHWPNPSSTEMTNTKIGDVKSDTANDYAGAPPDMIPAWLDRLVRRSGSPYLPSDMSYK